MTIKTKYGVFTNIDHIEPYGAPGCYQLGLMDDYYDEDIFEAPFDDDCEPEEPYAMLGFDAPIDYDPQWRFWVEFGDKWGDAETYDAGISESDKERIKQLYFEQTR